MTIGLDLGSHQFRSMWSNGNGLVARCCPAVFVPITDTSAHRRLLQQSNTRFATCSDQLLVFGNEAMEWAAMLNLATTPLLRGGHIPASDSIARQVLTIMLDALLPSPPALGGLCRMTLPGSSIDHRISSNDADFFQQLVSLRGYRPELMTATQALALAELSHASFTGIAITLGHSTCEFGVVHCGREILRCAVLNGFETFDDIPRLDSELTDIEASNLEREYSRFLSDVIMEAKLQFEQDRMLKTLPHPLPVICAGGIAQTPSFAQLFQKAWNESGWPVPTLPIKIAADPNLSVVRGCLIQAELDQPSQQHAA